MNAVQSLTILMAVLALASAKCRGRREILVDDEFRYPRGCALDDAKSPCSYSLQWRKQNETIAFTWRAKLAINQWVGFAWTKSVSLLDADAVILSLTQSNEINTTMPTTIASSTTIASPATIAPSNETTTDKLPGPHTTKSPKPIRSQKQQQKQGHQKQQQKHSSTTAKPLESSSTSKPLESTTVQPLASSSTTGKPVEVKLAPHLTSVILGEKGILRDHSQNALINPVFDFDHISGFVTVTFERLLTVSDPKGIDLKSTCPIWIFLPEPGPVIPSESSAAPRYEMRLPEGVLFYAYNPKCQAE